MEEEKFSEILELGDFKYFDRHLEEMDEDLEAVRKRIYNNKIGFCKGCNTEAGTENKVINPTLRILGIDPEGDYIIDNPRGVDRIVNGKIKFGIEQKKVSIKNPDMEQVSKYLNEYELLFWTNGKRWIIYTKSNDKTMKIAEFNIEDNDDMVRLKEIMSRLVDE